MKLVGACWPRAKAIANCFLRCYI